MFFLKNLFFRNRIEDYEESEWDKVQNEKKSLDLSDPFVRKQYVINCLEQMQDAQKEIDRVSGEYELVTSYLTDMEEIEAFHGDEKERLEGIAKHLSDLRKEHDNYVLTPSTMTDKEYSRMEAMFSQAENGIKRISEEEEYKEKVKSDLARIDKEKNAYGYRRREVRNTIDNYKGVAIISLISAASLIVILLLLQVLLDFDVKAGYYITFILLAIALTISYVKYADYIKEKKKIENTINELILLENKVKIRYVNNKNLLDYLYEKYGVNSSAELSDLFERFKKERDDRRRFERNEMIYEDELERLIRTLRNMDIKTPEVWKNQFEAIYDSREMVEIRHRLIGRRQKLRKQMEYNEQIATEAGDEIKNLTATYPEAAGSILDLVSAFERGELQ